MSTELPDGSEPVSSYLSKLEGISALDVSGLKKAEESYGDSWKRRGGVGAFMMLARKWDRLENRVKSDPTPYDIFKHIAADTRGEGLIDDIRDLRRYLMLVEAEMVARGTQLGGHRDDA